MGGNAMTRGEKLVKDADRCITEAARLRRAGEQDLARFYLNASVGFLNRVKGMTVGEMMENDGGM